MRAIQILIGAIVAMTSTSAFAWDDPEAWYRAADADMPGGGGIFGTGGKHDHDITCRDCHTDRVDNMNLKLDMTFTPALPVVSGMPSYTPGQRYQVAVNLRGTTLGPPCDQYQTHVDNFAAAFENDSGVVVGTLENDSGAIATNCPTTKQTAMSPGTTGLYGDCKVIFAKGNENIDAWSFYWTAPATGAVRIHYGAVDGNCDMMSMKDSVVVGTTSLKAPAMAQIAPPSDQRSPLGGGVVVASLGLVGFVVVRSRKRRTCSRCP